LSRVCLQTFFLLVISAHFDNTSINILFLWQLKLKHQTLTKGTVINFGSL